MAFQHVGIALAEEARALGQELALRHLRPGQHDGEPGGVGHRDRDDAVGLARRVRELEAGRGGHLDVERHPPQVAEAHAEERGLPGAQQELVHRIVEEPVGRVGSPRALAGDAQAVVPHPEGLRPRRALREPAVGAGPVERRHLHVALELLEEIGIGQEQERPERVVDGGHRALAPRVDRDVALAGAEGEQAAGGVVPEEEGIVVERQRDRGQLSRPRSRCSSLRAVT